MKPDCYECEHRGSVPGSEHSCCNHPKTESVKSPLMGLAMALGGMRKPQLKTGLNVKGNDIGIRGGWFAHPYNFDPLWLMECDGFSPKKTEEEKDNEGV